MAARRLSRMNFIDWRGCVEVFGKCTHNAVHRGVDLVVRQRFIGYVHESEVDPQAFGNGIILMTQPIGLAYAPTHQNAIYSVAQTFLRHRYNKRYRSIGTTSGIVSRHSPQRIAQARKRCSAGAE